MASDATGTPTLAAAQRAAAALAHAGVGRVLLVGSLARGIICTLGEPPLRVHDVEQLVARLPEAEQAAWHSITDNSGIDLHLWREGSSYSADLPISGFDESYLRTIAQVAANIAEHVTDKCESSGIDAAAVELGRDELQRLIETLDGEIRISEGRSIGRSEPD